jgi:ubiquinone/menaquinone biosynthesis C-methylase UbiE
MHLYCDCLLPHLLHWAMRQRRLAAYRQRLIPTAQGRVLEIGIGSGLNLPYYGGTVACVIGLDPSPRLLAMARRAAAHGALPVRLLEGTAESIPLADRSVDTVVTTWSLCSIPQAEAAIAELRRVLRPTGRLLFVEHGRAPEPSVYRWQDRLTPLWRRISGGCHLNRPVAALIEAGGFRFDRLDTGYMGQPKPFTFMYEGSARPA